jgi:hypothetical protein
MESGAYRNTHFLACDSRRHEGRRAAERYPRTIRLNVARSAVPCDRSNTQISEPPVLKSKTSPEVTDAWKASGQDVLQEAAQELFEYAEHSRTQ